MRQVVETVVVLLLLSAAAARGADDPVAVAVKTPGVGDVVAVRKEAGKDQKTTVKGKDGDTTDAKKELLRAEYTEEVLARPAGAAHPTKLRRAYAVAEKTVDGEKEDLGLAGKTVLIEFKDGKYGFALADGKPVPDAALAELEDEFKDKQTALRESDWLPEKPVAVGGTWAVDMKKLAAKAGKDAGFAVEPDKSRATGKLVKVYTKDGRRFGVLEITLDVRFALAKDGPFVPDAGARASGTVVLDVCLDGSAVAGTVRSDIKLEVSGEVVAADRPPTRVASAIGMLKTETREEVTKR